MKNHKNLVKINPNERVDDLQIKGYKIIQDPEVFCFGIDAVLLADFAKVKKKDKVLDIGTGTGIIPILMLARYENKSYVGIDIQEQMIERAKRSVRLNGIEEHVQMKHLDVKEITNTYPPNSFDVVTCNPPYMKGKAGLISDNESKMIARHEIRCSLEDIIQNAAYVLKDRGKLYMIHRPHRLVDIMVLMRQYRLEPKSMQMIYPKVGKAPTMVLIEGIKYAKAELMVKAPLYVYGDKGEYSDEIERIYAREEK